MKKKAWDITMAMTINGTPKTLIVIVGPTAIGKTAAAITLAARLKTEIISADSRQFYREMSIGTAKPSADELLAVKHHFINSHSITEEFNVGKFEQQGLALLDELFKLHNQVVMVGGSGLYIKAICEGFDPLPDIKPEIREKLNGELLEKGIAYLQQKLKTVDPLYFSQVDINNPQRVIRALEVFESTDIPFSNYRKAAQITRPFNIVKVGLNMPREQLYNRINKRVDLMMQQGLLPEVQLLKAYRHLNALNTVGYSELFDYFDGKLQLNEAVELIKQHTRNFAKRQITWFKKDGQINWFEPDDLPEEKILRLIA